MRNDFARLGCDEQLIMAESEYGMDSLVKSYPVDSSLSEPAQKKERVETDDASRGLYVYMF